MVSRFTIGIDAGSVAVKVVLLAGDAPRAWLQEPAGPDVAGQCKSILSRLAGQAGSAAAAPGDVCATGYGRNRVAEATVQVSEILANALGAGWMWRHWGGLESVWGDAPQPHRRPGKFRTIVDVGGQDTKVITLSPDGMVDRFAMNDRCAAGTGRFLEVMARVLGEDLAHLDQLALAAQSPTPISSVCTVFAESEVISLLADGVGREEVAAGVLQGVAQRVADLARQVGCCGPVMFDGGPSHSRALRGALSQTLGCRVAVPPCAEFTTALGAAVFAAGHHFDRGAGGAGG